MAVCDFSVFWDLYCAAPERRETCDHSSEAKAFHDYGFVNSGYSVNGIPHVRLVLNNTFGYIKVTNFMCIVQCTHGKHYGRCYSTRVDLCSTGLLALPAWAPGG